MPLFFLVKQTADLTQLVTSNILERVPATYNSLDSNINHRCMQRGIPHLPAAVISDAARLFQCEAGVSHQVSVATKKQSKLRVHWKASSK